MTGLDLTSFAETLSKGLKHFLKGENIKVKDSDFQELENNMIKDCLLYTSPSPRDLSTSRMPSSA